MIALLSQVVEPGTTEGSLWAQMRIHVVRNSIMADLGSSSKNIAEWPFLSMLRDEGRGAAETFLIENADSLGKRSSADLDRLLEGL